MTLDERLVDLLMRAEDLRAEGVSVSPEELCRDCPELLPAVRRLLPGTGAVEQLLHAPECVQIDTPTSPPADPAATSPEVANSTPHPPLPHVSGYEVLDELGRGGMGIVYRARHLALGRTVALKLIRAGERAGHRELARFKAEAEAAARLAHPNIVQVYEVGDSDGLPFLALEYVEGCTLARLLKEGPLAPREAAALVEALARALHLAHSRNVVHRDLKPANVLLASGGRKPPGEESPGGLRPPLAGWSPKITDFGLARRLDDDVRQTQSGAIVGTPAYMAPEQTAGQRDAVGPAADIHALGAILYECLAGRPPFQGKTTLDILEGVRHRDPEPPSKVRRPAPRDLETICLKCLRKQPEKRYGSAQELADDLGRFLRGEPVSARPVGAAARLLMWARRRPAVAALLAAMLVVGPTVVGLALNAVFRQKAAELDYAQHENDRQQEESRQRDAEAKRRSRENDAKVLLTRTDALGQDLRGADDVERAALWMLTRDKDSFKRRFFEAMLSQEDGTTRLGRRAEAAVRAGVGFNTGRRDALAALLKSKLSNDAREKPAVRQALIAVALELRPPDAELARKICHILLDDMQSRSAQGPKTGGPAKVPPDMDEVRRRNAEVERQAAEEAREAHTVSVLAATLDSDEAAEMRTRMALVLVERLRQHRAPDNFAVELTKLAEQLPSSSCRRVFHALLEVMPNFVLQSAPDALAFHMTADDAASVLRTLVEKLFQRNAEPPWSAGMMVSSLAKRLTPEQAAEIIRLLIEGDNRLGAHLAINSNIVFSWHPLPDLIEQLTPQQAPAIAELVFPLGIAMFQPGVSRLARKLPPDAATRWAIYFTGRITTDEPPKLSRPDQPGGSPVQKPRPGKPTTAPSSLYHSAAAVGLVAALIERIPNPRSSEIADRLADALLPEMIEADNPMPILRMISLVGPRLSPDRAASACCLVLEMMKDRSEQLGSVQQSKPRQNSEALDRGIVLHEIAQTLNRLVKPLTAERSGAVCAAALRYVLVSPTIPEDWDNEVMERLRGVERLIEGLSLRQVEIIAGEIVDELAAGKGPHDRGQLGVVLPRLIGRLTPEAADRLVSRVLPASGGSGRLLPEDLGRVATNGLDQPLILLVGRLSAKEASDRQAQFLAPVKQLADASRTKQPGDNRALALGVHILTSLAAPLPPDEAAFLVGVIMDWMERPRDHGPSTPVPGAGIQQALMGREKPVPGAGIQQAVMGQERARVNEEQLIEENVQNLIRLGPRLSPEKRDKLTRTLLALLARSDTDADLTDSDRLGPATLCRILAGWADHLTPETAGNGARLLLDRIARLMPPPPPPPKEPGRPAGPTTEDERRYRWPRFIDGLHDGLGALAARAGERDLVDLLKSPDCVGRRYELVRGALEKRLGRQFADPWEMADWLRRHRPDLDLDSPPRRLDSEEQP